MSERILDLCARHDVSISLSLPGIRTYREHTQAGDPGLVLDWFRRAKTKRVYTTVNIAVTQKNLPELFSTIGEALLAGANQLLLNRFLPGGRGVLHYAELMLAKDQIVEMLDVAEEVLRLSGRMGFVGTELPRCFFDPSRYRHLQVGTRCSAVRGFFVVGPAGQIRVCNHSFVELGHFSSVVRTVQRSPYWRRFAERDYLPAPCRDCRMASVCDGGCREAAHVASGSVTGCDPAF